MPASSSRSTNRSSARPGCSIPIWDVPQYRAFLERSVEIINHSLRGIPTELVRFHTCWGSGHRPHVNDIELRHIADLLVRIDAQQYSIEAANVRHEHEYHVWENVKLPDGKMLMPGVVAHATDLVEHPELIAERIVRYARLVGRENVQTGSDCGLGSRVGHEEVVWAKLQAMAEGARIASARLLAGVILNQPAELYHGQSWPSIMPVLDHP